MHRESFVMWDDLTRLVWLRACTEFLKTLTCTPLLCCTPVNGVEHILNDRSQPKCNTTQQEKQQWHDKIYNKCMQLVESVVLVMPYLTVLRSQRNNDCVQ